MRDRENIKALLEFSDDKGKITDDLTDDYKRGVQDALDRLDFLWMCEKYGCGDQESWKVMNTYQEAIIALELLIEGDYE